MIDLFKRFLSNDAADGQMRAGRDDDRDLTVAVCALFLEMGRIDESFSDQETALVLSLLKDKYGLSGEEVDALVAEADRELHESVDLWQFARVINERCRPEQKEKLMERLWRIVYVDGKMDQHEHYLMNKLSNLLRLSHKQMIDAKLRVLHGG
ncbi:hypothetical protein DSCA_48840 [Desulfosarcina alkanivorans]|jgi:uncharacterized tellurite resistance protein B-like protein|uniref:Co-chaperone DjlA N-terminal domain-containing protein n=1 Tax=Desulfosarcina alkanivorans TaxID=571177 RepID=A0A5K7YXD6_9BACT|nr:TerB family tellurite resistance protein [Desulfosarcina alkanivorans]BBO70954.1 hypothetical protein DSCA_48840 [Desulfosarcina alkanivorans]